MTTISKSNNKRLEPLSIRCGLCGYTFRADNCTNVCVGCSTAFSCNLLRCPNCGYTFPPPETSLGRLVKQLLHKIRGITR